MSTSPVILETDLNEFFRDEVGVARSDLGVEIDEMTEFYVVNLLCDYSMCGPSMPAPGAEPLALLHKRANEASMATRMKLLKNLGDVALYVSGFFAEFIERSLVDIDYYISMGGNAYGSLSDIVGGKPQGDTFAGLYNKLSDQFTEIVDLLMEISDRHHQTKNADADLLKLYDRWARTGSERIQKLLLEKGLIPTDGLPTEYIQ